MVLIIDELSFKRWFTIICFKMSVHNNNRFCYTVHKQSTDSLKKIAGIKTLGYYVIRNVRFVVVFLCIYNFVNIHLLHSNLLHLHCFYWLVLFSIFKIKQILNFPHTMGLLMIIRFDLGEKINTLLLVELHLLHWAIMVPSSVLLKLFEIAEFFEAIHYQVI